MTENDTHNGYLSDSDQSRSSYNNREVIINDDDCKENRKFPKNEDEQKALQATISAAINGDSKQQIDDTHNSIDWYTKQYEVVVQRNAALLSAYHQYLKPPSQQIPVSATLPPPLPAVDRYSYQNHALLAAQYAYHHHQNPYLLAASMCQTNGLPTQQPTQLLHPSANEPKFQIFSPNFNLFPAQAPPQSPTPSAPPTSSSSSSSHNIHQSNTPTAIQIKQSQLNQRTDEFQSDNEDEFYENEMMDDMDGDQSLNDTNGEWTYEEQFKQVFYFLFSYFSVRFYERLQSLHR
jgi:hypothetical protein